MSLLDAISHAFALLFSGDAALWRIVWVSLATTMAGDEDMADLRQV